MRRLTKWMMVAALIAAPAVHAVEDESNLEALRKAAEGGTVAAQYEMGVLYEFGFRLPENEVPALAWYMLAADNGDARAAERRDALAKRLKPQQVEEAIKLKSELAGKQPATAAPAATETPAADKPADVPAAKP